MKTLILYWSNGGNTKKVADTILSVMQAHNVETDIAEIKEDLKVDLYSYDLIFMGAPSYQWIPPVQVQNFVKNTMNRYRKGVRPVKAPKQVGKFGVVFCTYGGIHTGLDEGIIAGKYMRQFFAHMGLFVLDEWYTPGKFQGWDYGSKNGKLGDISNRPDESDLAIIRSNTEEILQGLAFIH